MSNYSLTNYGFCQSLSSTPAKRLNKINWLSTHVKHQNDLLHSTTDTILIGDSIAAGLSRFNDVWFKFFDKVLNFGIGGDRTQHVLWRLERLTIPESINTAIVHCGTNNVLKDRPSNIINSIICIAMMLKKKQPSIHVILTGLFPRDNKFSRYRQIIPLINDGLQNITSQIDFVSFLKPGDD